MRYGRKFDVPQGLEPFVYDAWSGTAEEAAEKVGKAGAARTKVRAADHKRLNGTAEAVPFQNTAKTDFFSSLVSPG